MHGKGLMKSVDNESYNGDWVDGKMHGQGKLIFDDG